MELVANEINNVYFRHIPEMAAKAYRIDVAVPYITDDTLFAVAEKYRIPCQIWCRIDEETSISTLRMLDRLLYSGNQGDFKVRATHNFLHAKVIYLHGVGCYIGSANLSKKAMYSNIEVGVFIRESNSNRELLEQLRTFFSTINGYTSKILREDIKRILDLFSKRECDRTIEELKAELSRVNKKYDDEWLKLKSSIFKDQKDPCYRQSEKSRHNRHVTDEWKLCLDLQRKYIRLYEEEFPSPSWIPSGVGPSTEVDRIFDWYYSEHINVEKHVPVMKLVEKGHSDNKSNADQKIREVFRMWSSLQTQPDDDFDYAFNERASVCKALLSKQKILQLSHEEISLVVFHCFALINHVDQFKSLKSLGLERVNVDERVPREQKAQRFVERYLSLPNDHGKSFLEVLSYFIWDDKKAPWEKIWECTDSKSKWKYPGIDRSTLGELIGLARPTEYPIRNNRTSRVLYYLGFEVDCV